MELKQAYQMVFNDLCKCRMFLGFYDAINGNPHYMHGNETVWKSSPVAHIMMISPNSSPECSRPM